MSLMHPFLAWFALAAVIPVILHFMLKAKPRKLVFPALRLIQNRRRQNVQRMRLRHIWLLLLRIALVVGLVLAVARPRVPPVDYTPTTAEWLRLAGITVAAVLAYFGLMHWWRRNRVPAFVLQARRAWLGSGVAVAAVALVLLLVLWPLQQRIRAEIKQPDLRAGTNIPVAAVLLFDTSLSMQYRNESQTRLDVARAIAGEHVSRLPAGSRMAVTDTSTTGPVLFQADSAGALARIKDLKVQPVAHPLNDRIRAALDAQREDQNRVLNLDSAVPAEQRQDAYLREMYVFTDLAGSAWRRDESETLKSSLTQLAGVNLYVLDVGVEKPLNVGLTPVKLSDPIVAQGSELIVRAGVAAIGFDELQPTVELLVENDSGKLVKQEHTSLKLSGSEGALLEFSLRGLTGPVRQGELRLVSSDDPLPFDDVQYFTLEVQPPQQVLVVADQPESARFWTEALAPSELRKSGKVRYTVSYLPPGKVEAEQLGKYVAVCLIDAHTLSGKAWDTLAAYVAQGGGLAVMLGSPVDAVSYNSTEARQILPAELEGHVSFIPPEYLDLQNMSHPLLKKFADWGVAELTSVEIQQYWKVKPLAGASVIAPYSDERHRPALLERLHGSGRVVLFTTAVSRNGWNDLPAAGWSFLAFADQTVRYLVRQSQSTFNYVAGEDVLVHLDGQTVDRYLLRKPSLQQLPGELPAGKTAILVPGVDQLGHYRLVGATAESKFERGFSVNFAPRENNLARLTPPELDDLLGPERYSLARTIEELDRKVRFGRIGREVFPFVLVLLVAAFSAEHLMANRFYA